MAIQLNQHFEPATLRRAQEYVVRGLVVSVERQRDGAILSQVSNGQGGIYNQRIALFEDLLLGACSCPVGHNCKHVAAALISLTGQTRQSVGGLTAPMQGWLDRVRQNTAASEVQDDQPEDYPQNIKERLLYILTPIGVPLKVDIYKGRMSAAGDSLNKSIRRYDVISAMRGNALAKFIRPVDLELLGALAQARVWEASYGYGLPEALHPKGQQAIGLLRQLTETGRLLYEPSPDAHLAWSEVHPDPRLAWRIGDSGDQKLGFEDASGAMLQLRGLEGATFWIDIEAKLIGALDQPIDLEVLRLVEVAPQVTAEQTEALSAALPDQIASFALPRPRNIREVRRVPSQRTARLTLGAETAHENAHRWGGSLLLPTLTLRFVYDGHVVAEHDPDPRVATDSEIVTFIRDREWENSCFSELIEAGAVPVEELEFHWPSERLLACDLVFADGEISSYSLDVSRMDDALDFAFQVVPKLRREGWEVFETPRWPYRLSHETASLSIATRDAPGEAFQGNDWFSLGFQAEIGGKSVDVAPLVAAFLKQYRQDWEEVPDRETLARYLADHPVYLNRGKQGYFALDLSPIAPLLQLFLAHHIELGALHPSDAGVARLVEDALAGSDVRFSDHAGIMPLARSLQALAEADNFAPPKGLRAQLRDYQSYGAAWMSRVLEAGFGGVLADDMGLGKTVQVLALLQARREADTPGPALLIVPTSLIYSWQDQARQFAPDLRLAVLHGNQRASHREAALQADIVVTTYPLLARDRDWLAAQKWPLVILDEAQTLKNPASQMAKCLREIPAQERLALTGTPLENSLQDLWTLFDWINPGLLGDRKSFQTLFRNPIEKRGDASAQARLNRRLRPFLLRRTKEQVAAELPPKTEILERVDMPKSQQALYETVRCVMDARVREAISTKGLAASRITVLDALLKLRQVCCDPMLVKTQAARAVADSAKRARLRELLSELVAQGRRVLVFSQFVEMLHLIETDLVVAEIPFVTLTGQTKNRAQVLKDFTNGDAPVFLLSLKAGGVGLTLTEADTVILYDPWWNPAVERQAMDRAHRIGQDKPVFVHRLVAAGTVEEKILGMQQRKQALADALFEADNEAAETLLDEATLQDLFAPLGP